MCNEHIINIDPTKTLENEPLKGEYQGDIPQELVITEENVLRKTIYNQEVTDRVRLVYSAIQNCVDLTHLPNIYYKPDFIKLLSEEGANEAQLAAIDTFLSDITKKRREPLVKQIRDRDFNGAVETGVLLKNYLRPHHIHESTWLRQGMNREEINVTTQEINAAIQAKLQTKKAS